MASARSLASAVRTARPLVTRTTPAVSRAFATAPRAILSLPSVRLVRPTAVSSHQLLGKRWSSVSATGSKIYSFEEVQDLSKAGAKSSSPIYLIDVREPGELSSTGRIPGAKNIPITTSPDSFHITPEEFEDRFGFERPGPEDEVVFYCRSGVRGRAAAGIAREAGWKKVGEYPGSWMDWSGKGGEIQRS